MGDTEDLLFKHQEKIQKRDAEVLSRLARIEAAIARLSRDAAFCVSASGASNLS